MEDHELTRLRKTGQAVCIMGPTGAGKTDLGVRLVEALPFEIISVDSAMIYRGLDIGTAKPPPAVLAKAPHRLINILDPSETYSAARFRIDALGEMADITQRGRIPLLIGGTGLYFRALLNKLDPLPPASPSVRARLDAEAGWLGWAALHKRLTGIDPQAAARIHPNDTQRIQRALEVYELTGKPMTALFRSKLNPHFPYQVVKFLLLPGDRTRLYVSLQARFLNMLEKGLLDEAAGLRRRNDLGREKPAMRLVGYRQVIQYLSGELDYQTMQEKALTATRQLAKRQITWFRAEPSAHRIDCQSNLLFVNVKKYVNRSIMFAV